jgi:hypothetical protein
VKKPASTEAYNGVMAKAVMGDYGRAVPAEELPGEGEGEGDEARPG